MKGGLLHNMAPNAKRSFMATLAFSAVAVAIYMFGVLPSQDALDKEGRRKSALDADQSRIRMDLSNAPNVKKNMDALEASMAPFKAAMLKPLLGSCAMRAKSILDPLVAGAGLKDAEYSEEQTRALPVTTPLARQLYARAAVKISATGSYQAAVSFLLRLENEFPLVSLQWLEFMAGQSPEKQSVTMVLEWPTKGKVTRQ